ncbi:MAG: hypothetical protein HRJ53_11135 [Acidobacteria bacterium Pan2503]|uniref:Uncharacterized protein n=1 Tax=Candidatus Acidiferrum panamense TaxID=2741543 RepID=A0A7V8NQV9_9BACT|nr:hypothetical protein [Candidatus Acidoferrum panamensis]
MVERIFHVKENQTTVRRELLAGLTTFMTMAYVVIVNPQILAEGGFRRRSAVRHLHFLCGGNAGYGTPGELPGMGLLESTLRHEECCLPRAV